MVLLTGGSWGSRRVRNLLWVIDWTIPSECRTYEDRLLFHHVSRPLPRWWEGFQQLGFQAEIDRCPTWRSTPSSLLDQSQLCLRWTIMIVCMYVMLCVHVCMYVTVCVYACMYILMYVSEFVSMSLHDLFVCISQVISVLEVWKPSWKICALMVSGKTVK